MTADMRVLAVLGVLVIAVPVSAIVTIMLSPLWGLVEDKLGIEALGHALPAGWCFVTVYVVAALVSVGAVMSVGRDKERE